VGAPHGSFAFDVLDMEPTSKVPIPYTLRAGFRSPSDSLALGKPVLKREGKTGASPKNFSG
jgi:hypothetical protein